MLIELMDLLQTYIVNKLEDGYEIEHKMESLSAFISFEGEVKYFVSGVYNSGSDWEEIDIKELNKLVKTCNLISEKVVK